MKVLIIGSGIAGLTSAIENAKNGNKVILVSPLVSERSQSVMAAGGINGYINENDTVEQFKVDTLNGGCNIESEETVLEFCKKSPECIKFLEDLGMLFTRDKDNNLVVRKLGGHKNARTVFAGTSTGKQIVTALLSKCLEYEIKGLIEKKYNLYFYSSLIKDGTCYGAIFSDAYTGSLSEIYADVTIFATGGQNKLYGKTTGSELCDGYATAKLFTEGVELRNLEFIQYHPTSIETSQKRLLISEAARSEGGRLFYFDNDKKVYFMEDKYGVNGNLMPRDICAREIYNIKSQVYLDLTFLDKTKFSTTLREIDEICKLYLQIDPSKDYIPVYPCIHFFMGGIKVDIHHETNVGNLFAIGEAASKYHGANRLGGNSLLCAIYSALCSAKYINEAKHEINNIPSFDEYIKNEEAFIDTMKQSKSLFPSVYILKDLADLMNKNLGIVRCEENLKAGLDALEFDLNTIKNIKFDPSVSIYQNYRLKYMLILAKATLLSALNRKESRGAHYRIDYTMQDDNFKKVSIARYNNGEINISFEEDK